MPHFEERIWARFESAEADNRKDAGRAELKDGIDPVEGKRLRRLKAELAAQTTFKLVANEFIQKMETEGRSPATIKKARCFSSC